MRREVQEIIRTPREDGSYTIVVTPRRRSYSAEIGIVPVDRTVTITSHYQQLSTTMDFNEE